MNMCASLNSDAVGSMPNVSFSSQGRSSAATIVASLVIPLVLLGLTCPAAYCGDPPVDWENDEYDVTHNFTFTPALGTVILDARSPYRATVEVASGPVCNLTGNNQGLTNVDPAAANSPDNQSVLRQCPDAEAEAHADIWWNAYGLAGPITGEMHCWGWAAITPRGVGADFARAYAYSERALSVLLLDIRAGRVRWSANLADIISGARSKEKGVFHDPITFSVYDPATGRTVSDTLLAIRWQRLEPCGGEITWENDDFLMSAEDAEFVYDLNSPYTNPQGYARLVVRDRVVSVSEDSGIFDGLLPAVGTAAPLAFQFPNETTFDYSLPTPPGSESLEGKADDLEITMNFGGDGDAELAKHRVYQYPALTWPGVAVLATLLVVGAWLALRKKAIQPGV